MESSVRNSAGLRVRCPASSDADGEAITATTDGGTFDTTIYDLTEKTSDTERSHWHDASESYELHKCDPCRAAGAECTFVVDDVCGRCILESIPCHGGRKFMTEMEFTPMWPLDYTSYLSPTTKTPAFAEYLVNPIDSHYFSFFLKKMPHSISYSDIFPSVIPDVFCRGVQHACVCRSILATASLIADYRLNRSMDRSVQLYITTIQMVQRAIKDMEIDEGLAIAVLLLGWCDAVRCRYASCRKHLQGFALILQNIHSQKQDPVPTLGAALPRALRVSPLMMLLWRIAIRIDWHIQFYAAKEPVVPLSPNVDDFNRRWLQVIISGDAIEWALAGFALDNIAHKCCLYGSQICSMWQKGKPSDGTLKQIKSLAGLLDIEIAAWRRRRITQEADKLEAAAQSARSGIEDDGDDSSPHVVFLSYPRLFVANPFYLNLLNNWRALWIYVSLMRDPFILSAEYSAQRRDHAIEICRALAALKYDASYRQASKYFSMLFAKIGFGGSRQSPEEMGWLLRTCAEWGALFPQIWESVKEFGGLWDCTDNFWIALNGAVSRLGGWWTDSE